MVYTRGSTAERKGCRLDVDEIVWGICTEEVGDMWDRVGGRMGRGLKHGNIHHTERVGGRIGRGLKYGSFHHHPKPHHLGDCENRSAIRAMDRRWTCVFECLDMVHSTKDENQNGRP